MGGFLARRALASSQTMHIIFRNLAVLCVFWVTAAVAQFQIQKQSPLFISGSNGFACYRIPAFVCSTNGTLLAFCEGRTNVTDGSAVAIVLRRSTDGGQTWGAMTIVQQEGYTNGVTIGNPAPVVDETTGKIFLFFCRNTSQLFYTVSTDDGLTWSNRVDVTTNCILDSWIGIGSGPGHGIQLQRGTQAGRLIVPGKHTLTSAIDGDHVTYSDDHGATWQLGASTNSVNDIRPNENEAVELVSPALGGGSQIYFNSRNQVGTGYNNRCESWSINGGASYIGTFTTNSWFVTPVCQGSLQRLRATDEGAGTNYIVFCSPNDPTNRVNLSFWISTDEASSWSAPTTVYSGPSGYSDMARTSTGDLALVCEQGVSDYRETITFYRFAGPPQAGVVMKCTSGSDLGLANAWGSGSGPLPTTINVATWTNSSLGGTLTNSIAQIFGAIDIEGATAPIIVNGQSLTLSGGQAINTVTNSGLFLAASGVDLSLNNTSIFLGASQTWTVGSGRTLTVFGGTLNLGTYTLTLAGTGTNYIQDTYAGSGNIVVNGPTYIVNSSGSGRSGTTTLTSGVIAQYNNSTPFGTGALYLNGGTIGSASSANRTPTNSVFIGGDVTFGYSTGTMTFSGGTDLGGANRTLTCNVATTFAGAVSDGGLTKEGTYTLTFSGTNTYTGNTIVSAGTLALSANGSIPNTPLISVAKGAIFQVSGLNATFNLGASQTLSGGGTIKGNMTADGTIAPGPANPNLNTLTFSNLMVDGNLVFELNKSLPQSNDVISAIGTLINTGTGTLTVTNLGPALAVGDQFYLFNKAVAGGNALTIAPPAGVTFSNKLAVNGSIIVLTAPSLNPPALVNNVSGGTNLVLNWPLANLGYRLLMQTNHLTNGLSSNTNDWGTVPGSAGTNQVFIPIIATNPATFFKLTYP